MKLLSKIYGEIKYEEEDIIIFKRGMLGLEKLKKYIIIELKDYEPFKLLQSIEDESIGFIMVSPFELFNEYEFKLNELLIERLNIQKQEDVLVLNTVTLNSDVDKITSNFKAPIIINISNNLGEQIILDEDKYKIKQPLIRE